MRPSDFEMRMSVRSQTCKYSIFDITIKEMIRNLETGLVH